MEPGWALKGMCATVLLSHSSCGPECEGMLNRPLGVEFVRDCFMAFGGPLASYWRGLFWRSRPYNRVLEVSKVTCCVALQARFAEGGRALWSAAAAVCRIEESDLLLLMSSSAQGFKHTTSGVSDSGFLHCFEDSVVSSLSLVVTFLKFFLDPSFAMF